MRVGRIFATACALVLVSGAALAAGADPGQSGETLPGNNFHVVDAKPNGFGFYRTGRPSWEQYQDMVCRGITQIFVLSGNGDVENGFNARTDKRCPGKIEVIQPPIQNVRRPLSKAFLAEFDAKIRAAQAAGTKIAIRCNCGCHRTGRLAAYYRLRYMPGTTAKDAFAELKDYAHPEHFSPALTAYWWLVAGKLKKQVAALDDYVHGRPCSIRKRKFCVDDAAAAPDATDAIAAEPDDVEYAESLAAVGPAPTRAPAESTQSVNSLAPAPVSGRPGAPVAPGADVGPAH